MGLPVFPNMHDYRADPAFAKDPAEVTSDWREPPNSDPESSLIGTIYEGYPADAAFVVAGQRADTLPASATATRVRRCVGSIARGLMVWNFR